MRRQHRPPHIPLIPLSFLMSLISLISLISLTSLTVFSATHPPSHERANTPPHNVTELVESSQPDLFVYRWRSSPPPEAADRAHRITLGLSDQQMRDLYLLSDGRVDFEGLYALKLPEGNRTSTPRTLTPATLPGLLDQIVSGAPPPFFNTGIKNSPGNPPTFDFSSVADSESESLSPPDPELKGQWWIDNLHVPEAWRLATGRGITLVDCDAGFYIQEDDLHDNLLLEHRYSMTNEANHADVETGRFITHGTSVVAILAGVLNSTGTNGIAYESKVIPIQNFTYDASIDKIDKEEATAQCVLRGITLPDVRVIVLENQTHGSSETFAGTREAVRLALKSGITIVSAAGNSAHELVDEAKDDTGSIIVGAISKAETQLRFSNYGSRVSIAAYGEYLRTLFGPKGQFGYFGGTSGATPQVAATVAMMLELNPDLTPAQIKNLLETTRVNSDETSKVGGRLDVLAAVKAAMNTRADHEEMQKARRFREQARSILLRVERTQN